VSRRVPASARWDARLCEQLLPATATLQDLTHCPERSAFIRRMSCMTVHCPAAAVARQDIHQKETQTRTRWGVVYW
jgi:hypothetical protein